MKDIIDRGSRASLVGLMAVAVALASTACGDDGTGPENPENADPVGQWNYAVSDATGVGVDGVCDISGITLSFTRDNGALAGSVTAAGGDNLVCVSTTGTSLRTVEGTVALENIEVDGSEIRFEFRNLTSAALNNAVPFVSTGTVSGNGDSMSGTVTFSLRFGTSGGVVTRAMTGTWSATRQ